MPLLRKFTGWYDNERFYHYLKFYSLNDLRLQGANYLKRSNNSPMDVLNLRSPNQQRQFLEQSSF